MIKAIKRFFYRRTLKNNFEDAYSKYILFIICYKDVLKSERKVSYNIRKYAINEYHKLRFSVKDCSKNLTEKEIKLLKRKINISYSHLL